MRRTMNHVFRLAGAGQGLRLTVALGMLLVAMMAFASEVRAQDDPQCIDGIPDRDGDGQISSIEAAQAGADATQGGACSSTDAQYGEDGQSIANAENATGFTGECAGAIERLAAEQPNVSEEVFQSYYSYLSDVGGCVSFEGNTFIGRLSVPVYDSETGEELGIVKDLDPDLTSGEFSVTHEEFCGGFIPAYEAVAQEYFDQEANSQEQAILDPDGDGLPCTDEDDAVLSGDGESQSSVAPCSDFLGYSEGYWGYFPDSGGCVLLEGIGGLLVSVLNAPVLDSETEEELGSVKDLDPDLTSGDFSVTYSEFCEAFPTPELEGYSYTGLTVQEYYDQGANDKERAILDPDGDGLACTSDDEEFLAGGTGGGDEKQFKETWSGRITQTWDDDDTLESEVEAEIIPIPEMTEEMIGEVVGIVRYLGFCTQTWILVEVNEDSVVVEGRLEDPTSNCFEFIPITLTIRDDDSLEYYYSDTEYSGGSIGEGILTLQESGNYDEIQFEETWSGFITEFDDEDNPVGGYELEIEIMPVSEMTEDMIGEVVGRSTLSLGCTGIYYLEEVNEDSVRVEAPVETGFENCVDGIHVLTPQVDGTLEHYTPGESNASTSRGILTREGSFAPYEVDLPLGETWAGPLTQTMQDGTTLDFDLEVELLSISEMTEGMVGQIVGETSQEGIECNGVWLLEEIGEDSILVVERITSGADDCVESTRITLTPQDDESLDYYFLDSYGSTGEGVLTLQESNPPEYEMEEIGVPEDTGEPLLPSEIWRERGVTELPDTGGPVLSPRRSPCRLWLPTTW